MERDNSGIELPTTPLEVLIEHLGQLLTCIGIAPILRPIFPKIKDDCKTIMAIAAEAENDPNKLDDFRKFKYKIFYHLNIYSRLINPKDSCHDLLFYFKESLDITERFLKKDKTLLTEYLTDAEKLMKLLDHSRGQIRQ